MYLVFTASSQKVHRKFTESPQHNHCQEPAPEPLSKTARSNIEKEMMTGRTRNGKILSPSQINERQLKLRATYQAMNRIADFSGLQERYHINVVGILKKLDETVRLDGQLTRLDMRVGFERVNQRFDNLIDGLNCATVRLDAAMKAQSESSTRALEVATQCHDLLTGKPSMQASSADQ